jgi:hypothetical protein
MRLSVIEGAFAVFVFALQQAFYIPYLNELGASKLQIGVGAGLPALMTGLIQIWVPVLLVRAKTYKKIVFLGSLIQGLCMVPLGLMWYILPHNPIWPSIAAVTVSATAMGIGMAAWADWMSYIVPRRRRGKYFSRRARILTVIQLAATVTAGYMLDHTAAKTLLVFTIIWFLCFITRTISSICLIYYYEPEKMKNRPRTKSSFTRFVRQQLPTSFGKFVLAVSLIHLGVNFSGPFFAIYMLNDLKLTYIRYTVLHLTPALTIIATMGVWGKICDRVGCVTPMRLAAFLITILPLMWVITQNYYLLLFNQLVAGIAWGGFMLATFNYTLGALAPTDRVNNISYLNAITFICIFLGALMGGLIGPLLPKISDYQLHSVFLLSVLIRIGPALLFQLVSEDKPLHSRLSPMERFFFDPRLSLRLGLTRSVFSRQKRPL